MPATAALPYRADHVGSLLRPDALHEARRQREASAISEEELKNVEDDAIREAVALQESAGMPVATDGEFRRANFLTDFMYQLGGVEYAPPAGREFHNDAGEVVAPPSVLQVTGKVTLDKPIFTDDFNFLKGVVSSATPKLAIPSPSMVHYRGGRGAISQAVYPDIEDFWSDLSTAYAAQVAALGKLGCNYLQLDDTSLAYLNDPKQRAEVAARGDDPDHQHLRYIEQINSAVADRPDGMTIALHMCRGNARSSWVAEGSYDFVAEALFSTLDVDGFFLEYDDDRSGGFEPLRFVPKGKRVVLGLVTSKRGELEDKDQLKRRVEEASKYLDLDQLCLSPQCGFASSEEGNLLTIEQEAAKLRLVVETATEIWGSTSS